MVSIKNWNLYLVEEGLRLYLGNRVSPSNGYKLAADYCQHYDPKYGTSLNGPSRTKVEEILHFVVTIPSPIGMSDFGFGHHPARIAMAWHPGVSKVAVERTVAKA